MLPCACPVIDHRRRKSVVRTSVTHSAASRMPLSCSYHILTSSVLYHWACAEQHESICQLCSQTTFDDTSSMFFSPNAKMKHNPIIVTSPYFRFTLKKDSRSIETGHGALLMNSIVVFPTPGAAGPSPMVWTTTTIATISSKIIHKWSHIQTCLKLYRQPEVENFFSHFLFFSGGGGWGSEVEEGLQPLFNL